MAAARPLCLVCETAEGKYKCPRCTASTCSVACSREHRDNHPPIEPTPASPHPPATAPNTTEGVANSSEQLAKNPKGVTRLSTIADMPEYENLLRRYPELEAQLWRIAAATDPPKAGNEGGQNHNARGLNFSQNRNSKQPWTRDVGMENGRKVLQRAATSPTTLGQAITEFIKLDKIFKARLESEELAAQIRRRSVQEDAHVISRLLRDEQKADKS